MTFRAAMSHPRGPDGHDERCGGLALTEFALTIPLGLVLFIGILDFGRVFYTAMTVSHAARAGVQYGAQNNGTSGDFAGMRDVVKNAAGDVNRDITPTACRFCQCADGSGSCTSCSGDSVLGMATDRCSDASGCLSACPSGAPRVYVQVSAEKVFTTLFPYPSIPRTTDIKRQVIMRVQ